MARITVEDCLDNIPNRFQLVRLASRRAKQLLAGDHAVTDTKGNKAVVSALREIADGKVRFASAQDAPVLEDGEMEEETGANSELASSEELDSASAS
jgi:DNA-directed RNA polymerase subunit omega